MSEFVCHDCNRLLEVYRQAVRIYSVAAHQLSGLLGDDYTMAMEKVDRLRLVCQDAHTEVLSHWRSKHHLSATGA